MAHSKLYIKIMNSPQWRSVRAKKLQMDPYCEECGRSGVVTEAQCVHHKIEIESQRTEKDAWSVGLSLGNLVSLCFACHRSIHAGHNTKAAHKKRADDRLAAWISEQNGETKSEV